MPLSSLSLSVSDKVGSFAEIFLGYNERSKVKGKGYVSVVPLLSLTDQVTSLFVNSHLPRLFNCIH